MKQYFTQRYQACLLTIISVVFALGSQAQTITTNTWYQPKDFEPLVTGLIGNSGGTGPVTTTTSGQFRTGSTGITASPSSTTQRYWYNNNINVFPGVTTGNVHIIYWARATQNSASSITSTPNIRYTTAAAPGAGSSSSTTGSPTTGAITLSTTAWTRISGYTTVNNSSRIYFAAPFYQSVGNGSAVFYFDDIVMYYDASTTTDVVAPSTAPSALSISGGNLSWTNGTDAGTGVQGALVLGTNQSSPTTPTVSTENASILHQGFYPVGATVTAGGTTWTVLANTSGTSAAVSGYSTYAVINYDRGYNYSAATTFAAVACVTPPTASAGGPDNICQSATPSAFTLSGASYGGSANTAAWSITNLSPANGGLNGTLSSTAQTATPATVTYTPPANYTGVVTLTLTTDAGGAGCSPATSTRTLNINAAPTVAAGTAVVSCSNTVGAVTIGTGATAANSTVAWTSSGTGTIGDGTSVTGATYTPSPADITAGSVTLTITATGTNTGCTSVTTSADKAFTINTAPSANAGAAASTASNVPFQVTDASAANFSSLSWSTNGTGLGTISLPGSLTPTYNPVAGDVAISPVILTLTAVGNAGCANATSDKSLTITAASQIITTGTITGSPFCAGAIVSVPYDAIGFTGSNTYTAQLSDASGSFASPVNIGTDVQSGEVTGGSISATIPSNTVAGSAYLIRVVETGSSILGTDNGSNLVVNRSPEIQSQSTAGATYSVNTTAAALTVTVTGASLNYQWYSSTDAATNTTGDDLTVGTNSNSFTPSTSTVGTLYYYCVITGACAPSATSAVSGAITVNLASNATDFFRSRQNGNWNVADNWESSVTGNDPWITATLVPGTSAASVQVKDSISIVSAVTTNDITVTSAGILALNTGGTLALNSGRTLTVAGNLQNAVVGSNPFSGGTIVVNGTFNLTAAPNTNSGAAHIPAATWGGSSVCRISGIIGTSSADYTGLNGIAQSFNIFEINTPNLVGKILLQSTAAFGSANLFRVLSTGVGTANSQGLQLSTATAGRTGITVAAYQQDAGLVHIVSNSTSTVGRTMVVTGNFTLNGGIFNVAQYTSTSNNPTPVTSLTVRGNLTVASGATLQKDLSVAGSVNFVTVSLILDGTTTLTNNGTITGLNAITLTANSTLNLGTANIGNSSNTAFNSGAGSTIRTAAAGGLNSGLTVGGTITLNGTTNYEFNGAVPQSTGALLTQAGNLTINNPAGVTLNAPVTVTGTLNLSNGLLVTTSNLLTLGTAASITGSGATRYINGPLRRNLPTQGTTATVLFPVGTATDYLPAELSYTTSAATSAVQVSPTGTGSGGNVDGTLNNISTTEYWTLSTTGTDITSLSASLAKANLGAFNKIGRSNTTANGTYTSIGGNTGVTVGGLNAIGVSSAVTATPATPGTFFLALATGCTAPDSKNVTGSAVICSGNNTNITLAASQTGVTYELFANNTATGNTQAGSGGDLVWNVSPVSTTAYTVRTVNADGYCAVEMNGTATVTIQVAVGGIASGAQTICTGTTPAGNLTVTEFDGAVTKWQYSNDNFVSDINDITNPSATLTGAVIGALTNNTYFRAVVEFGCTSANSSVVLITVEVAPSGGSVSSSQAICSGFTPAGLTATGFTGTLQWQSSTTDAFSGFTDIIGETGTSYNPPVLTQTTYYRVVASVAGCSSANSSVATITVNPRPDNASGAVNDTRCGTGTVNLSVSDPGAGLVVDWYADASGGTALFTGLTYSPTIAATTTYHAEIRNSSTACTSTGRLAVTGTVNQAPSISGQPSAAAVTFIQFGSATPLTVTASGAGLSYQWFVNTEASNSGGTPVGSNSASYTPSTNSLGTTYYYCVVTGNCTPAAVSNVSGAITIALPVFNFVDGSAVGTPAEPAAGWTNPGIGTYFRSTSTSALTFTTTTLCNGYTRANASGNSEIFFRPDFDISAISISGTGTGQNRTFSSINTNTTIGGTYTAITVANASGSLGPGGAANCGTISITNIGTIAAGTFIRINFSGNVNTTAITLTRACNNPVISGQPNGYSVCQNSPATALSVTATGTSLTYQWFSNTVNANTGGTSLGAGAQNSSYIPSSATAGTFYYYCLVSSQGCSVASAVATVTVNSTPVITSENLGGATYGQGNPANPLSITATGATSYQWYSNTVASNSGGTLIDGETNDFYTPLTNDQGTTYYYCVVTGDCGTVTSSVSGAIVVAEPCIPPSFFDMPIDFQEQCVNGGLTLGTVVVDDPNATFQWYSNTVKSITGGIPVTSGDGGTTDTYTPPSDQSGIFYYYCVATVGACSTPSDVVEIKINRTEIISQQTAAATYALNQTPVPLSVNAAGADLFYQWYKNNVPSNSGGTIIDGESGSTFTPPTNEIGTNYYYCEVGGSCDPFMATSAVSGAITVVPYTAGDFMSRANGSWELAATWNTWNGTAWVPAANFPNSTTASTYSVYIDGGFTVTYNPSSQGTIYTCLNLHVVNGTLRTGTGLTGTSAGGNRRYLSVFGTKVEISASGTLGSAVVGDGADAISLDLRNTGTVTFSGSGGTASFALIRYNNTSQVVIDRDITLNYKGSTSQGNAMGYHSNVAPPTVDHTLTVNAGKTLTFAPWSCFSASGTSGQLGTANLTLIVNGTFTMMPFGSAFTTPRGYLNMGVTGAGKSFFINVGGTGVMNLQEFYPNSTGTGTGNTGTVNVSAGGVINVENETDLRDNNTITGGGTFNVLSGALLKIGNAAGITSSGASGAIQTGTRTFSAAASYVYESTTAQVTGNALPATVSNLTISNTAGVTLSGSVSVDGILALTSGRLTTNAFKVTTSAAGAGALTGASATNYVVGNLERAVPAGASVVAFPIGTASSYSPVSLSFGASNTAGLVTAAAAIPGVPPAAGFAPAGSGISQTKYINRSWTLSSTISSASYAATFTYINPGDIVGGANTTALIAGRQDGGAWSNPGVASLTSTTLTTESGLTGFGTFALGEEGCLDVSLASAEATSSPICSNATTTLVATGLAGTNAVVNWYTGSGGTGTQVGTGLTSNQVGPGTYYAYATGDCGTPVEIPVTVGLSSFTITVTVGANGSITPGTGSVNCGSNATYNIAADPGFIIQDVLVDGSSVGPVPSYTFNNVTSARTISATFAVAPCINNNFSGTGNWTDGNRWSCGAPPNPGDNVTILAGSNVTLNTDFTVVGTFIMTATSSMTVNPDVTFSVSGSANFAGQSVTFKSDATGYGSLGQVTGTLTGATNVTVERYLPNNGFRSWRLLSVPTSGSQTIKQAWQENNAPMANTTAPGYGTLITGGGNNTAVSQANGFDFSGPNTSMQFWNGTGWSNITGTLGALSARQAYFLYVRGDRSKGVTGAITEAGATTLRSNGTVYTGNQPFSVPAGQFQLIPNLYPSAINFTGLTRSGLANSYIVWDSKTQVGNQLGRYVTFALADGWAPNPPSISYPTPGSYTTIESGQAFFVQDDPFTVGGGTITLVESAKTNGSVSGHLGLRPVKRASLRTTISNEQGVLDGNSVVFDAAFSNVVDGDDARKMGNPGANFGIEAEGKLLAVEGRQPAQENDAVQFRMWNLNTGNYTLKLDADNITQPGIEAVLEDSYTKQVTSLQLNGSTEVSFSVTTDAASKAANRFRVVFRKGISGIDAVPAIAVSPNPVTGGVINLRLTNQPQGRYTVRVMSPNGQVLLSRVVVHAGGNSNQSLNLGNRFVSGNYVLEVINPALQRTVQSLLIKN